MYGLFSKPFVATSVLFAVDCLRKCVTETAWEYLKVFKKHESTL